MPDIYSYQTSVIKNINDFYDLFVSQFPQHRWDCVVSLSTNSVNVHHFLRGLIINIRQATQTSLSTNVTKPHVVP